MKKVLLIIVLVIFCGCTTVKISQVLPGEGSTFSNAAINMTDETTTPIETDLRAAQNQAN
jgi:uncharacterized protein YceK